LVIALTLWGCVVITPEFARVFGDYATLGFFADNDGVITVVDGSPASDAGANVHVGDCIDFARTPLADRLAVFGGMGGLTYVRPGLVVTLYVAPSPCMRGTATERVLAARIKPISRANRVVLFLNQTLGLFFIGLAAILVWQRPSAMTWGFFLYAIWFNPGQFFVFYAELQRWPIALLIQECLQATAQAVGYAGFVVFALRFPNNRIEGRWHLLERGFLPVIAAAILLLSLLGFGAGFGIPSERFSRWSYGAGYLVDLGVLLILRMRRKQLPPEDEQRTRWVHWGCRVGLAAFIFADSNMATTWWDPVWKPLCTNNSWLASSLCDGGALSETTLLSVFLVNALVPLAVFHAVRRHRVISISFAVSRGTTLVLTWLIIAAAITGVSILIEDLLHSVPSMQFLLYFAAILLMKIAFEWLHERLNEGCDRIFFRRLHLAERRLEEVRSELGEANTFDTIDTRLIEEPAKSLDLASAAVFRRDGAGIYRRHAQSFGWTSERDGAAFSGEELERKLGGKRSPVRLDAISPNVALPEGAAQPVLAAPLFGASGIAAVALYGAHRAGDDLTKEEYILLQDLSTAAGHAYSRVEALQLREQVRDQKERLEQMPYGVTDDPEASLLGP